MSSGVSAPNTRDDFYHIVDPLKELGNRAFRRPTGHLCKSLNILVQKPYGFYHYRRAKLLRTVARYDKAQADYGEFANIMGEIRAEISGEELDFKKDLDCRTAAGDDSEQRRRDELMRAIDISAASMHLMSQDKTKSHRFEASSFGEVPARHSSTPRGGARTPWAKCLPRIDGHFLRHFGLQA